MRRGLDGARCRVERWAPSVRFGAARTRRRRRLRQASNFLRRRCDRDGPYARSGSPPAPPTDFAVPRKSASRGVLQFRNIRVISRPSRRFLARDEVLPPDDRQVPTTLRWYVRDHACSNVTPPIVVRMSIRLGTTPIWNTTSSVARSSRVSSWSGAPKATSAFHTRATLSGVERIQLARPPVARGGRAPPPRALRSPGSPPRPRQRGQHLCEVSAHDPDPGTPRLGG